MEKLFFCNFSIFFVGQKKINVYLCIRNKNKERTKKEQRKTKSINSHEIYGFKRLDQWRIKK